MEDLQNKIIELMDLFDGEVTTADKIPQPAPRQDVVEIDAVNEFMKRNPMAGGGMLVQPSADGSRPGYKEEKYITPAKRTGADDFQGQKHYVVKDDSYSDGRKKVKTKEYSAWLKNEQEKHKKNPNRYKQMSNPRREPGLLRIAEAMKQANINDDAEFMMPNKKAIKAQEKYHNRKMKVFKKGMLEAGDIVYINNLEKNIDDVIFIADQLGEDSDWVLNMLEERTNFRNFSRGEKDILKQDPKYKKPRNDYLKVENWVQKNAKRYANPETFENALIKRFGKDNQFVKDMNSKKGSVQTYFSKDFKKTMLNITAEKSRNTPDHLKQFIKSSLYNFNPKIKNAVTEEIKNIFNSENLPKLRTEARKLLNNNKLLSTFGLNKAITGPYAKVIQAEIGQQLFSDINNFRQHRVGTKEMLKAFEQIVAEEFKPMFAESAKAISFSQNNQWGKAKEILGLADNIAWDHKVPSSLIDKGYADIIEYTKVNPTTSNFNERIKNAQFDRPINKLITKFEKATTLDAKAKIKNEMDIIKDDFSKKFGGYLDDVNINLDSQGNLKFSSSAGPLKMTDDTVQMLGKSMTQAGEINKKQYANLLNAFCGSGRVKQASGTNPDGLTCSMEEIQRGIQRETDKAKRVSKDGRIPKKFGKLRTLGTTLFGVADPAIEFMFAAPYLVAGDIDGAKQATTAGLFGYGKKDINKMSNKEAQRYVKHLRSTEDWMNNYFIAEQSKQVLKNIKPNTGAFEIATNQLNRANENMANIADDYGKFGYSFVGADTPLQGKVAMQNQIREEVAQDYNTKIDKAASTEFFKDSDPKLLRQNLEFVDKYAPKEVTPITDLESYMANKGEPMAGNENLFFNVKPYVLNRATQYGVGNIFDDYALGAGVEAPGRKSLQDAYSEIPLEYANQLAALEKKQLEEGLLKKELNLGTGFAGGGIANLAKGGRAGFNSGSKLTLKSNYYPKIKEMLDHYKYYQSFPKSKSEKILPLKIFAREFYKENLASGGLAGIKSGPPPESGPNSQGLSGLLKRGKNI